MLGSQRGNQIASAYGGGKSSQQVLVKSSIPLSKEPSTCR